MIGLLSHKLYLSNYKSQINIVKHDFCELNLVLN